jgi:GABA(A) receptor-associated protein
MSQLQLQDGELDKLKRNYPDKIPVFITKSKYAKGDLPDIRKHKFLVPAQFTMAEFLMTIRKWMILKPEQAIFVFIENNLPMTGALMSELYEKHKSADGVLRMCYSAENTFG